MNHGDGLRCICVMDGRRMGSRVWSAGSVFSHFDSMQQLKATESSCSTIRIEWNDFNSEFGGHTF